MGRVKRDTRAARCRDRQIPSRTVTGTAKQVAPDTGTLDVFAATLRVIRRRRRLTQLTLAERTVMTRSSVANMERGQPTTARPGRPGQPREGTPRPRRRPRGDGAVALAEVAIQPVITCEECAPLPMPRFRTRRCACAWSMP